MTKYTIIIAVIFLLKQPVTGQSVYTLSGIADFQKGKLYIEYTPNDITYVDSVEVIAGRFEYKKSINGSCEAKIYRTKAKPFSFFLHEGSYVFEYANNHFKLIKAPATEKQYRYFRSIQDSLQAAIYAYGIASAQKDSITLARLPRVFDSLNSAGTTIAEKLINEGAEEPIAFFLFDRIMGAYRLDAPEVSKAFGRLPEKIKNTVQGKNYEKLIKAAQSTRVGNSAPLFQQKDTSGKMVALKNFRGQYVLLDFWASWCKPCREENPFVVQAFKQYATKGFTVISISLDNSYLKSAWLNAIKKDGLQMWTHLSGLKGFDDEVAQQYGIRSIPASYLIDPDGKIIAKDLRGEKLLEKLAEIYQ